MQVAAAVIAFLMLTRVPENYHPEPHPAARRWLPRSIVAPGIAIGAVSVQYPVIAGFLILHLKPHGNCGPAAFSAYAGMILFSRFFLGRIADRSTLHHMHFCRSGIHGCGIAGVGRRTGAGGRRRRWRATGFDSRFRGPPWLPPPSCSAAEACRAARRSPSSAPSTISPWG
jgi:hypothetical protein